MKKTFTIIVVLISCLPNSILGNISAKNRYFIENKGQWPDNVLFNTRLNLLDVWITKEGIYYDFYKIEKNNTDELKRGHLVKISNLNTSFEPVKPIMKLKSEGYYNFFKNNNTVSNVGLYKEVILENVFDGINQRWYFEENGGLRYDYIVKPNANYNTIKLKIEGDYGTKINNNDLVFFTRFGAVKHTELLVYQIINNKKHIIPSKWKKTGDYYSFEIMDKYDPSYDLIIDPLIWSTFLGGDAADEIHDMYVKSDGTIALTGNTLSSDFPVTSLGAYDITYNDYWDVFITILNSNGNGLIYSSFLGGNLNDYGKGIYIDSNNEIYISGSTFSSDFPTTASAYDQTINGANDIFVTKLNSAGTALIFSTYIGGNQSDDVAGIKIDANKNIYLAGTTSSTNFPTTSGVYDQIYNGGLDIYALKLNSSGSSLFYSTYIGGNLNDVCNSFTLDGSNNIYVCGYSESNNYPTTSGVFSTTPSNTDVVISKISTSGGLLLSTVIGGSAYDYGRSIHVDLSNKVTIAATTGSNNFPITNNGIYDASYNGSGDIVLFQLNSNLTTLNYSTYIGGSGDDRPTDLIKTAANEYIITGLTNSTDFPTTMNAYQKTQKGNFDALIVKVTPDFSQVNYASYLGGDTMEIGERVFYHPIDNYVIIAGNTFSANFPVTSGAYDVTFNTYGQQEAFISKLYLCPIINFTPSSNSPVCIGDTVQLNCGISATGYTYSWYKGTFPIFSSNQCNPSFVSSILSSGYYSITATNTSNGCKYVDSVLVMVQLKPDTSVTVINNTLTANQNGASYQWLDCDNGFAPIAGATGQSYTTSINGNYAVKITLGACVDTSNCYNISTISMNEIFYNKAFKIYPNPAREALTIEVSENSKLEIYAYDGKLVAQENIANRTVLNVSNFNNGIYFVRLTNEAGESYHTKFVKN
jgi:hypothetical protein